MQPGGAQPQLGEECAASGPSAPAQGHPGVSWIRSEKQGTAIELDPGEMAKVINRLRRAQGQLGGVLRMLEQGRDCEDIVTQISAVSRALDRAGFAIVAAGMRQCLVAADGDEALHAYKLERLFLSLA